MDSCKQQKRKKQIKHERGGRGIKPLDERREDAKVLIRTPTFGGDEGGESWDEGQRGEVRQIFIYHGDSISSIQTACGSDKVTLLEKHGGNGPEFSVVNLGSRSLKSIRGHYSHYRGYGSNPVVVRSLTFVTDDGSVYGPFGTEEGTAFSFHLDGARFGGFHGRSCDRFLRAIGIYVATDATGCAVNKKLPSASQSKNNGKINFSCCAVSRGS